MEKLLSDNIGKRLDIYIAEREDISRSASQKLIQAGLVTVNGLKSAKNYRIREGDEIECDIPEAVSVENTVAEDIPLDIVYEDESLLVVNKPKGMVVHPAPGHYTGTLVNALLWHCRGSLSGINGVIRPGIVHRIDKDTTGLLAVAKTDVAHESLAVQLASHSFEREYRALVCGNLKEDKGTVSAPIYRHPIDRKKMAVVEGGREAVTHYEVVERFSGFTYAKMNLETGRTHQIRVHMSHLGHPLMGDEIYGGGKTAFEKKHQKLISGQCLHAKTISFIHPVSGELMRFDSELPEYFLNLLAKGRELL